MTGDEALAALTSRIDKARGASMRQYHKVDRLYLGIPNPELDLLARDWRKQLDTPARITIADHLWQSNIYEARVLAAKLLTSARLRPDDTAAWALIFGWHVDFDSWAIADHACMAGQRRLTADPSRLDQIEPWTRSDHMWTKRAALVMTLPWTKQNHPKPQELEARERILSWAANYIPDKEWFIQKAIAWWLRELSKHDAPRVITFLDQHGPDMKPFARKEAAKHLNA